MRPAEEGAPVSVLAPVDWRATAKAYLALAKPRIIELLLVTTVPAMFLAAGGFPPWQLVLWTLLGRPTGATAWRYWHDRARAMCPLAKPRKRSAAWRA